MPRYQVSKVLYVGPNRDGSGDVSLVAALGGNEKTSSVISLVIAPTAAVRACQAVPKGSHVTKVTAAYVDGLASVIRDVCGSCVLADRATAKPLGLYACYAQKNFQNAGQPAAICRQATGEPSPGVLDLGTWADVLTMAGMMGVSHVRSAVAGDLGMLPESVARAFVDAVPDAFDWLGYTHQWYRTPWLRETHMASTQGKASAYRAAVSRGWRAFHVHLGSNPNVPTDLVHCPEQAAKLRGAHVSCIGCKHKCDGAADAPRRSTFVIDHGPGARVATSAAGLAVMGAS